jgi:hypothetical protein
MGGYRAYPQGRFGGATNLHTSVEYLDVRALSSVWVEAPALAPAFQYSAAFVIGEDTPIATCSPTRGRVSERNIHVIGGFFPNGTQHSTMEILRGSAAERWTTSGQGGGLVESFSFVAVDPNCTRNCACFLCHDNRAQFVRTGYRPHPP